MPAAGTSHSFTSRTHRACDLIECEKPPVESDGPFLKRKGLSNQIEQTLVVPKRTRGITHRIYHCPDMLSLQVDRLLVEFVGSGNNTRVRLVGALRHDQVNELLRHIDVRLFERRSDDAAAATRSRNPDGRFA